MKSTNRDNKVLAILLALVFMFSTTMTAFAASPTRAEAEKVFAGDGLKVYDTKKTAVSLYATEFFSYDNPRQGGSYALEQHFFSSAGEKLGTISMEMYNGIIRKYTKTTTGVYEAPTDDGDWVKWFCDMFNAYRQNDNVTLSERPAETPIMSNNPIQEAPATHALKDKINALTLTPVIGENWNADFCSRIQKLADSKNTNYEKLWAVYNDVAANYSKEYNCVGYAVTLKCAFDVVGFETYYMCGSVTAVGGGWTAHSWVGVVIDGKLYYFDANIPGKYNGSLTTYFAGSPKNATFYKDAYIQELNIEAPFAGTYTVLKSYQIPENLL